MFKKLTIKEWRQFSNLDIDFHEQVTILTGANGSGKTTILNILSSFFGWHYNFISTPSRDKEKGILNFFSGFFSRINLPGNIIDVGKIVFKDEKISNIRIPIDVHETYQLNFDNTPNINGVHLPSHRSLYRYHKVTQIPTESLKKRQIFDLYSNIVKNFHLNSQINRPVNYSLKENLISLAIFGEGNKYITSNKESLEIFEGFQEILRIVLPMELGFQRIIIENPEVVLETKSGNFSLDAASGGIASIIDISWQIFMHSDKNESSVVTIDEPENHLHPKLQRSILPNLVKAFPQCQFIVVTHNPFIVTSVPDSKVYVFDYNQDNKVYSNELDLINKAGSSNDILREVLGLPSASPLWVEEKIDAIVNKFSDKIFDNQTLADLRLELHSLGLSSLIPETIVKVRESKSDKTW